MSVFDLDPASPNVLAGGKRPRTTLSPSIVTRDGKPFLAIGTPGGDTQDQQIAQVLLNIILGGQNIQQAIEAPRLDSMHMHQSFGDKRDAPGVFEVEERVPVDVLTALVRRGHRISPTGEYGIASAMVAAGVDGEIRHLAGWSRCARRALRVRMVSGAPRGEPACEHAFRVECPDVRLRRADAGTDADALDRIRAGAGAGAVPVRAPAGHGRSRREFRAAWLHRGNCGAPRVPSTSAQRCHRRLLRPRILSRPAGRGRDRTGKGAWLQGSVAGGAFDGVASARCSLRAPTRRMSPACSPSHRSSGTRT